MEEVDQEDLNYVRGSINLVTKNMAGTYAQSNLAIHTIPEQ